MAEISNVCKFSIGDKVRLLDSYGTHNTGEEFTVRGVRRGSYDTAGDTWMLMVGNPDTPDGFTAFQHRFEKVVEKEDKPMGDIKWKTVDYDNFSSHLDTPESPSRVTYFGNSHSDLYEIGATPAKLPVKPGAIVAPFGNSEFEGYNPYILGVNGEWYESSQENGMVIAHDWEVQSYLDQGWVVAFPGLDD